MSNGVTQKTTYDTAERVEAITLMTTSTNTVLAKHERTYDPNGNPLTDTLTRGSTTETRSYMYGTTERLAGVCYNSNLTNPCTTSLADTVWVYDKDGNRTSETNKTGTSTVWGYDLSDQLTSVKVGNDPTTHPYGYDTHGNLITDGVNTYTYNVLGQQTSITQAGLTTTYKYDSEGNRVSATDTSGVATTYQWDTSSTLPQLASMAVSDYCTGTYQTHISNLRYDNTGSLLNQTVDGTVSWVGHDPLGSTTELLTGQGAVAATFDYTPYGATRGPSNPPGSPQPVLGYAGGLATSTGWHYGARDYNTSLGAFTSPDPLASSGGAYTTTYHYGYGSPLRYTDPSGNCAVNPVANDACFVDLFDTLTFGLVGVAGRSIGDANSLAATGKSSEAWRTLGVGVGEGVAAAAVGVVATVGTGGLAARGAEVSLNALRATRFGGWASDTLKAAGELVSKFPALRVGSKVTEEGADGMSGVVTFETRPHWSADQIADAQAYVDSANKALREGKLSPTGRVSTKGTLYNESKQAIRAEKQRALEAGTPYKGVAGHGPDTTWTGTAVPPEWLDMDLSVNSSLGAQAASRYPIGFKPTGFRLVKGV
jgi:RHS repeat-associated protein